MILLPAPGGSHREFCRNCKTLRKGRVPVKCNSGSSCMRRSPVIDFIHSNWKLPDSVEWYVNEYVSLAKCLM